MDVTENAKRYREKMFPESESSLQNTDPEFVERLDNFALDEVVNSDEQAQIDIFGEHMRGFAESGEADVRHINKWLTENCFGDYYTRGGLDYRQRELITFCFLSAQGGCEPQLIAHAKANIRLGNDKAFLIKVISQCLPYLGYPRSLNALTCVETADKELRK